MLSSIQDSLRYDVVEPHLDSISIRLENSKPHTIPTLVMVLAVSGGCDSIGLFHSILEILERNELTNDQFTKKGKPNSKNDHYYKPPLWLVLGENVVPCGNNQKRNSTAKASRKQSLANSLKVPCEIHVAHFNHEQRGGNSDGDEAFVKSLCQTRGIQFHGFSWSKDFVEKDKFNKPERGEFDDDVNELSDNGEDQNENGSYSFTQDTARRWRQRRLLELLSDFVQGEENKGYVHNPEISNHRWGVILTAHHRDDADETVLMKFLRGTHITNLRGMEPRSGAIDLVSLKMVDPVYHDGADRDATSKHSVGYFAKPMLGVRKSCVMDYLRSNLIQWREDESNSTNKYKRNKVRNELIPLLRDIAGGESALQKRISNIEQQSRQISNDLSMRAKKYLDSMPRDTPFILRKSKGGVEKFGLVEQEAFHLWVTRMTKKELQFSYEQIIRIRDQIQLHPDRLQWTLDVGDSWRVRRDGEALVVMKNEEDNFDHWYKFQNATTIQSWKITSIESKAGELKKQIYDEAFTNMVELRFSNFPCHVDTSTLAVQKLKDVGNMKFVPPWKKGRSAIKVKEFLRGQKIPLHLRNDAWVVCSSDDHLSHTAMAVYLDQTSGNRKGEWVVHADFGHDNNTFSIRVTLESCQKNVDINAHRTQ